MQPTQQFTLPQALQLAQQQISAGQLALADSVCWQILAAAPNQPQALQLLGMIAMQVGRADVAIQCLAQSAAGQPQHAGVRVDLGNALLAAGRSDEAITAYRQAIALDGRHAGAMSNLGIALFEMRQIDEAMEHLRRAVELEPGSAESLNNLGHALKVRGAFSEAIDVLREAISLRPNWIEPHQNLANAFHSSGQIDLAIATIREALRISPQSASLHSGLLMFMQFDPGADPKSIFDEHRRWNQIHAAPLNPRIATPTNDRSPDRRLRIGYVSPDMREHAVAYFLESLLGAHDHRQFEIFCYADVLRRPDAMSDRLKSDADQWRNITGVVDAALYELIRNDQIDILVDLAGHTAGNRLLVFARKPAPIQFTYLGYPSTTGLDCIDYRLTDEHADPVGSTDAFHSERLIRLPDCFLCYKAHLDAPEVGPLPANANGYVAFGSFNQLAKINDPLIALWCRILLAVPTSRLLIKCGGLDDAKTRQSLVDRFAAGGVAADRLDLRDKVSSFQAHLELYNQVDIALDAYPYHGTTTTCEALWMGVPVVTLAGTAHVSRVSASLLTNIGMSELIALTPEQYVRIAVELADDPQRIASMRDSMRRRVSGSPLLNAPAFAAKVEQAYRAAWQQWCRGGSSL